MTLNLEMKGVPVNFGNTNRFIDMTGKYLCRICAKEVDTNSNIQHIMFGSSNDADKLK